MGARITKFEQHRNGFALDRVFNTQLQNDNCYAGCGIYHLTHHRS